MTPDAQQPEQIEQLKKHLQQLKNDGFKVIADCESLSIALPAHNQNDDPLFTYDQVTDAIAFFHANARVPTLAEMKGDFPLFIRPHTPAPSGCCDIETITPQPECFGHWKGIDSDCNCNQWGYCADVTIRARAATLAEAQRIELKLRENRCVEEYQPNYMGCAGCSFLIVYDEDIECALAESLRKQQAGEQR